MAEVDNIRISVRRQAEIWKADVAVYDPRFVDFLQSFQQGQSNAACEKIISALSG